MTTRSALRSLPVLPLCLALVGPAAAAAQPADDLLDEQGAVVDWINGAREEAGLEPLRPDRRLFEVAQRRAEGLAEAGSVSTDARALQRVSQQLLAAGYQAHRWTERAILGYDDPVRMVRSWSVGADRSFADTSLGPFEELGVGIARTEDGALTLSLLFAVPRSTELVRLSEPLGDLDAVRSKVLERTNRARRGHGGRLAPLAESRELNRAAQRYAERMLEEGFYAHVAPDGGTPSTRAAAEGYRPVLFLAENIAQGLFEPEEVVERWLESRDHRRNILHPRAVDTGLGVAFGDTEEGFRVLWVQMFGRQGR